MTPPVRIGYFDSPLMLTYDLYACATTPYGVF